MVEILFGWRHSKIETEADGRRTDENDIKKHTHLEPTSHGWDMSLIVAHNLNLRLAHYVRVPIPTFLPLQLWLPFMQDRYQCKGWCSRLSSSLIKSSCISSTSYPKRKS